MKNKIGLIFILVLIGLSIIVTGVVYPMLPNTIPTHWGINGEVNGWSHKSFAFFTACLPLIMYIFLIFLPKIDPKKESYEKHKKAYDVMIYVITLFLVALHWVTIVYALGVKVQVDMIVTIGVAILFMVLGNYMTQIRQNYFFGLKTPWTLANEEVWKKSNRVGGYGFIISGVLTLISLAFAPIVRFTVLILSCTISALYSVLYSYLEYRKIEGKNKE